MRWVINTRRYPDRQDRNLETMMLVDMFLPGNHHPLDRYYSARAQ